MVQLLLLSSSRVHGSPGFLGHALPAIAELMAGRERMLFIPYARRDFDDYARIAHSVLSSAGIKVDGLHRATDPVRAIASAEAVFLGGGNTFRLLATLQRQGLVRALRRAVLAGVPYLGSSAGTNLACPSLRTSNDMPIVQPASFAALGLVPFQINPHYLPPDPASTHRGETRDERIAEFLEHNDVPVLALREGAWLRVRGRRAELGGADAARLFTRRAPARDLAPGTDLTHLLGTIPRYDLC
ncbi:dipeptidase PepE [Saccharopolyspora gregorii]|uniref:Dipeptidase PepE n=1 Tax=Saccharopolyspora gregorii TaxID=33914 RepID=A0ABP6RV36_9PSEU|nr:dipeptidase PepE [Saccharopolyspora gregorii]